MFRFGHEAFRIRSSHSVRHRRGSVRPRFLTLSAFMEHSDAIGASKALAGLPILSFPKLLEVLEQREGRKNLTDRKRTPIYTFSGFQIAWPLMALYGWILLATVDAISGGFVIGVDTAI